MPNTWVTNGPVDFSIREASESAPRTMSELMDKMGHDRRFSKYISPVKGNVRSAKAHYEAKDLPLSLLKSVWGITYTKLTEMEEDDPTYTILLPGTGRGVSSETIDIIYED